MGPGNRKARKILVFARCLLFFVLPAAVGLPPGDLLWHRLSSLLLLLAAVLTAVAPATGPAAVASGT